MRRAIQLDIAGHRLFGTLHEQDSPVSSPNRQACQRIGVLLLSFGQQPRSWVGDLGSSIADRLGAQGYPVFRFDMPGLGDSPGAIPVHLEELWRNIQLGAHERPLFELCEELSRRFSLKGLVIGGFCGGAVTALLAANARLPLLRGVALLEPDLALARTSSPSAVEASAPMSVDSFLESVDLLWARLHSPASWRRLITGKADFNFWLKLWYKLLDYAARKLAAVGRRTQSLPHETNHRAFNAWHVARRLRLPTLVISDGSPNRNKYYRAYGLQPGVSDPKSALHWVEIPNTTHAMVTGGAKDAVGNCFESWVAANFPLIPTEQ